MWHTRTPTRCRGSKLLHHVMCSAASTLVLIIACSTYVATAQVPPNATTSLRSSTPGNTLKEYVVFAKDPPGRSAIPQLGIDIANVVPGRYIQPIATQRRGIEFWIVPLNEIEVGRLIGRNPNVSILLKRWHYVPALMRRLTYLEGRGPRKHRYCQVPRFGYSTTKHSPSAECSGRLESGILA